MGHLGFSYVGAVFLLALFIPNIVWARWVQPKGYDPSDEPVVLKVFERAGQALTTASALVFADTNLRTWSGRSAWLVIAVALMLLYELCWVRYFRDPTMATFYGSLGPIPVPLASLPVTAFFLLGLYGALGPLMVSAVLLGIGHIGIHLRHRS